MRKAARKDFYMEIRKSTGRFLSILFIVALGVAFLAGIRASEPDMRLTGDSYFDDTGLMDVKALSTYGVTEEDVEAMEALEGVAMAEGAYSADFLYNLEDEQRVLHVMGNQEKMNQVTVTEGKMPEAVGECLADDESGYQIGDVLTLTSGTEEAVSDTLKTDTLTVVGRGNSPCYLSYGRGSTTIGAGSVDAFLVVPEETFCMEVFTEVYIQVKGAKELTAFTDEYEKKIEAVLDEVEALAKERGIIRRQEITDEAEEELADAKKELEDAKEEVRQELSDAEKEIEDAEKQLADAKEEIADGRVQIADAKKTLKARQKELDTAKSEYESGRKKLTEGKKEYETGLAAYNKNKAQADPQIKTGREQAEALHAQISEDEKVYDTLRTQIENLKQQLTQGSESNGNTEESEGSEAEGSQDDEQTDFENPDAGLSDQEREEIQAQIAKLETQAAGMKQKIEAQKQAYAAAKAELDAAQKELEDGAKQLASAKAEISSSEKTLSNAKKQIKSGQSQIDDAWKELEAQEKKLDDGEKEIAENETKLADAKQEYEDGKKEADKEIEDAEKEIADAEEEIADIKEPKWHVYDRSVLVEYSGFGENAERLGAIGKVFPALFFLVAALISLTSMTRMVEEQRTAIGTMKALGYSKFAIASKYLGYACLAAVGGSVLGVLLGEKILPYIIVYAYGILYRHLPEILVPYQWSYAALASGAAIFCTLGATFLSCYKELRAQPAVLMRPPSPKNGRRVFLERISFVWKHLNFTWKSTVRNLMRYKKRFFMTIFGIGGCMALMLVGFGLKDSCYEIAEIQYDEIQLYNGSIYMEEDVTGKQREQVWHVLDDETHVEKYMDADLQNMTLTNGKRDRDAYVCIPGDQEQIADFVDFHDRRSKESYLLSDNGVIMSEKTAKLLGVEAGDTVYIKDDEEGNKEIRIEHICENYMGHYIYMTPVYYEKLYGEEPEFNSILLVTSDGLEKEQIEEIGERLLSEDGVLSLSYTHDIEKQLDDMLRSLNLVIVVLIISAGMLAFVVLYNLNTVNIAERKRELATLKVLGFYDGEVAAYVYRENIILTLIGALVGVGLGKILHRFIIETVEVENAMFGRNINLPSYLYSLLFTIGFSLLINGIMYFKLKRIDMVESLKSIE